MPKLAPSLPRSALARSLSRYALSTELEYHGYAGSYSPWSAVDTKEACVEEFLSSARLKDRSTPSGPILNILWFLTNELYWTK